MCALDRFLLSLTNTYPAMGVETIEGELLEFAQITHAEQLVPHPVLDLLLAANTRDDLAEIRVADWQVSAQIAQTTAVRALGIAQAIPVRFRIQGSACSFRGSVGEPFQNLLDLLGHPCLCSSNLRGWR